MNEDDLMKIADSIQEKIGKENSATIADDIGLLITKNSEALKSLASKDEEIKQLQSRNEKLVLANGNLLQQIPMGEDNSVRKEETQEQTKHINLKACFDSRGNFISK